MAMNRLFDIAIRTRAAWVRLRQGLAIRKTGFCHVHQRARQQMTRLGQIPATGNDSREIKHLAVNGLFQVLVHGLVGYHFS